MKPILKSIKHFFKAEKTVYAHRNRTIEIIAQEKNIDIDTIKDDARNILQNEGRIEAIVKLRKRFQVPLVTACIFVDRLDLKK